MISDGRSSFLDTLEADVVSVDSESLQSILIELFAITFDRNADRLLRRRCLRIGEKCLNKSQEVTIPTILGQINRYEQVSGRTTAASSALVCLEWLNICLNSKSIVHSYGPKLISYQALLLDVCCSTGAKAGVRNSALRQVRSNLNSQLKDRIGTDNFVQHYIPTLTGPSSSGRYGLLIGELISLAYQDPEGRSAILSCKTQLLEFYIRNYLSSKETTAATSCQGLDPFFRLVVANEDISQTLLPVMLKSLLRAPELVADPVMTAFLSSVRVEDVETGKLLVDGLTKPLISTFKSSNASTRERGLKALIALQGRSVHNTDVVVDELVKCYTIERPGIDQRVTIADCLQRLTLTGSAAQSCLNSVLSLLAKESNEAASLNLISAVWRAVSEITVSESISNKSLIEAIRKGLVEKKASIRNQWICSLASLLLVEAHSETAISLIESLIDTLIAAWQSDTKAPLLSLQNGFLAGSYGLTTILLLTSNNAAIDRHLVKVNFRSQIYSMKTPSFIFSEKLCSKIHTKEERKWLANSLEAIAKEARGEWSSISDSWAAILLQIHMEDTEKQRLACIKSGQDQEILSASLVEQTSIQVWQQTGSSPLLDETSPTAQFLEAGLRAAVSGLRGSRDAFKDHLLIEMLVLAHHPCLGGKLLWIELCQAVSRDPSSVVVSNLDKVLHRAMDSIVFLRNEQAPVASQAALSAITSIAFVSPNDAIPRIVLRIQEDLSRSRLAEIDSESVGIWLTPEGQTYVNVIDKHSATTSVVDKNTRDWETAQWEASVRTQIAEKKALPKKLSKDEQARLAIQLAKESTIRGNISADVSSIRRGLGLIRSLNQTFIQSQLWFAPVIKCLLSDLVVSSRPFIGTEVANAYLECATHAKNLGTDSRLLGLATLKLFSFQDQEETRDLINRVLYKLRFASEQEPFDFFSFVYALPLTNAVLMSNSAEARGATGCKTDDQIDEQTFLALEFLNRNINGFSDERVERLKSLDALICVIHSRPSQASDARTTIQSLFSAMSGNATQAELKYICSKFCHDDTNVRNALLSSAEPLDFTDLEFSTQLWLAMHDDSLQNADLARTLFEENAMVVTLATRQETMPYLQSSSGFEQICASRAIANTFEHFHDGLQDLLEQLMNMYCDAAAEDPVEYDRFGQVIIKIGKIDRKSKTRKTIALAIIELSSLAEFEGSHVADVSRFLLQPVANGRCPLADISSEVRDAMLQAGASIIRVKGEALVETLLPIFEHGLARQGSSQEDDWTREAAVILYGAAASYLSDVDARVPKVIDKLLTTLGTPSESVQLAIARCLPALVAKDSVHQADYLHSMLTLLSDGRTYAERRGAAFGLSGVVQGCGISSLQGMQVLESLKAAITNKKSVKARQGALFAYECFAQLLGNLWEPYVQDIIALLLLTYADSDTEVRSATQDTAKAIMSRISGYGVQLILPFLLSGLNDHQWRSKKGSVELIGAMAYCAPRQLSASLPTIIPRLNEVLTDSHAQVRAAGNDSLTRFGQVINNPEIQELVPILLKALSDPNKYTENALDSLLKTSFLHYIDSPSLSILIPILERGMQERSATTKKKSSKIFGLLASLTSPNDLVPHLGSLVPCLRNVLIDTVPDVRATAAKALGSLVEKLGERNFPDLVTNFLDILNSDVASTDRQGAAQGLAEVLAGLGLDRLEDTLPRILKDSRSRFAYVREGFISLLIYLPATFGTRFAPYLAKSIGPILAGLADESEFVRDASLRAGKIMIANYASKSVDLMLPELERGMFNDSWRIRVSSLQLIGDLLFKVSGISTKLQADDEDEDEAVATEAQRNALLDALGQNRRDRIFSSLYVARFDGFAMVRSSAINVWKTLVANTPKTLRDILPSLIETIIQSLAIENSEKRAVFIDTLGDLMRKMGRDLLTQLLPAFEDGLRSSDADKIGVCVAITEVIQSGNSEHIEELQDRFVSAIKVVLIDKNADVRAAANETFDTLQTHYGPKVIDQVLPDLLALLQSDSKAEEALEALKGLMQVRSHIILPILLPSLLIRPMTGFNLQAIGSLVRVAGHALTRRLPVLLTTILDAEVNGEAAQDASDAFETILLSTPDGAESVAAVMNVMLELARHEDYHKRAQACQHLSVFFSRSRLDYSRYTSDWVRVLLGLFADPSKDVVERSWQAQDALTKSLRKEELAQLVIPVRRSLQSACTAGCDLAGFSLPKGIGAILPILLQGLLYGSLEQKEEAANGLGDVIQRTNPESLRIFVTQITGPLIRIIGERSGPEVKSAILSTLRLLLQKIPTALKPFLPQLQRSFTKSLADSDEAVRSKAAAALGSLIALQTARVDPLINELVQGSQSPETHISSAMLSALFEVVGKAGSTIGPGSKTSIIALIRTMAASDDSSASSRAADLLGVLFRTLNEESQAKSLLTDIVIVTPATMFSSTSLNGLLLNSAEKIAEIHATNDIAQYLSRSILSTQSIIAERSITAAGKLLLSPVLNGQFSANQSLILSLAKCIETVPSSSSDTQRLSLIVIHAVSKKTDIVRPHIDDLGLVIFGCVRSMILPVKLAAEAAFVGLFQMTEHQNELLQPFLEKQDPTKARSIGEYAKRVASKVANAENERAAAGITSRDDDIDEIMGYHGTEDHAF